jgi:carbon storage regulator
MLVLTRKEGQKIVLQELAVEITVLSIRGNQVRIGIKANSDVNVWREEIPEENRNRNRNGNGNGNGQAGDNTPA